MAFKKHWDRVAEQSPGLLPTQAFTPAAPGPAVRPVTTDAQGNTIWEDANGNITAAPGQVAPGARITQTQTGISVPDYLGNIIKESAAPAGGRFKAMSGGGNAAEWWGDGDMYKTPEHVYLGNRGTYVDPSDPTNTLQNSFLTPDKRALTEYWTPEVQAGRRSLLNGKPYDILDAQGNVTGQGTFEGLSDADSMDNVALAMVSLGFGAALAGAGAAATGAGASGGAGAGAGTASMGAGAAGSAGTGLSLGGGGLGLGAQAGQGLALTNGATGLGMTAGSAGAGSIGAGLGAGLAGGAGTLLGPAALQGTTTLSNGTILQGVGGTAAAGGAGGAGGASGVSGAGAASGAGGAASGAGPGAGGAASGAGSLIPGISNGDLLGAISTIGGAIGGGQGQQANTSTSRELPAFLQAPVANDLVPRTQGLLNSQMPQAQQAGQQMMTAGQGLLGRPVAGNGVGQVTLNTPTTAQNPYLSGLADDISRRTDDLLGKSFNNIRGNFVGSGGLGGSRQGVAEAEAMKGAADSLQGNLAGLYGDAWNSDANRALQQYGMDQGFFTSQRGQDLTQAGIGGSLLNDGLNTQWGPLLNTARTYSPFTGFGNTTSSQESGGGWQGALGGALTGASLGRQMGWW